jgi:TPR repeat protein
METDKRRLVRKRTDQLLYAEFGPDNGSILLNLSEDGCSFQSLAPVREQHVCFSVSVGDGRKLQGVGQMAWSDIAKKTGGLRFLNPSPELREQVRAWLNQTLVTTDGKLDPAAVESEAKRRRKKLREEAKAEAERARREGVPKKSDGETLREANLTLQPARRETSANTYEARNITMVGEATAREAFGNSAVTLRRIGAIALGVLLLIGLTTYRRELGHLVMSLGSSIAGENGGTTAQTEAQPTPVNLSSEVKADVTPVVHDTAGDSSVDVADTAIGADTAEPGIIRPAEVVPTVAAKRTRAHQESGLDEVTSLWTSVENGDTAAEVNLAIRYVRGDGVPQSCAQARVLLEAAAKRGSPEGKQKLGELGKYGCP